MPMKIKFQFYRLVHTRLRRTDAHVLILLVNGRHLVTTEKTDSPLPHSKGSEQLTEIL